MRVVTYRLLVSEPVPIWHIGAGHKPRLQDEPIIDLYRNLERINGKSWVAFRGTPIDRFLTVFLTGVDKSPTNSPIFCADEDKAYEYARPNDGISGPGLLYALHGAYLERSYRTLSADASAEEIAEVQCTYPHRYEDPFGQLHLSRLPDQVNLAYEAAYGYWIPGNAREALLAIFLIGAADEVTDALKAITS